MTATLGRYHTARALVAAGADVDARDVCDETPLRIAAYNGFPEIVKILLCAGANVELANGRGLQIMKSLLYSDFV
jgi:ankyrin repeat protein